MKYVPARLLSTHPNHLQALLSLGCSEQRAKELIQEAALSNPYAMLIDIREDEWAAITTGEDGQSWLWDAFPPLGCDTQQQALDFIEHVEERRKEPSTWAVLEWNPMSLH
jgi:hypothetical protein